MSKHYLQEKITGTQGQVVGFDASGNAVAQAAPQTGYSKTETLQDATKALFGLTSAAVPDDVFAWLGKYNEHCWRRAAVSSIYSDLVNYKIVCNTSARSIQYSSEITFSGGTPALVNPQTISISTSSGATLKNLAPCYIGNLVDSTATGQIFYLPSGIQNGSSEAYGIWNQGTNYLFIDGRATIGVKPKVPTASVGENFDLVFDALQSTYPSSGTLNGYMYQYVGVPFNNLASVPTKIETGSYVGTGTYGQANAISITASFAPKLFLMYAGKTTSYGWYSIIGTELTGSTVIAIPMSVVPTVYTQRFGFMRGSTATINMYGKKSDDGKTFSWYCSQNYPTQMYNESGVEYYWLAIG